MRRSAAISIALLALVALVLVSGTAADVGAICRQKRLHVPDLICPGDLSVTVWISPSIALAISEFDWDRRRMADGLEAMSVGI